MRLPLIYADGSIAIFGTGLCDYRQNEEEKKRLILEVDLENPSNLNERGNDYPLNLELMTI